MTHVADVDSFLHASSLLKSKIILEDNICVMD